ncbi:acyltransferase [Methanobrevibacter millerae]|uniref:Acyltransferase n=1 Tax=Methanobrevibacter millerae TaxID=230361 RepID=A0A0U3EE87_9EURY|nr:acyltransferase family protein [Methanobrevibacter millerae]ALT69937.1 acyltransferase [Methanobrevibacter millerae]
MNNNRIVYFDFIRSFAIISVLVIHVSAFTCVSIIPQFDLGPSLNWWIYNFDINFFKCGVDLFLMLTGALLLSRKWNIKSFLIKKIPRIIKPFIFWTVVSLILFLGCYKFLYFNIPPFNSFTEIINFIFTSQGIFTHYWYFWMILGVYLTIPIYNLFVLNASQNELEYFMIIWILSSFLFFDPLHKLPNYLIYLSSPIGFVIAGYYLRITNRKILNNPYFALCCIFLSVSLSMLFSFIYSNSQVIVEWNRYSIFPAVESIGIFILFKNFHKLNLHFFKFHKLKNILINCVHSLAKCSYGIYLFHLIVLYLVNGVIYASFNGRFKLWSLLLFVLTLFISWSIIAILEKIPHMKEFVT